MTTMNNTQSGSPFTPGRMPASAAPEGFVIGMANLKDVESKVSLHPEEPPVLDLASLGQTPDSFMIQAQALVRSMRPEGSKARGTKVSTVARASMGTHGIKKTKTTGLERVIQKYMNEAKAQAAVAPGSGLATHEAPEAAEAPLAFSSPVQADVSIEVVQQDHANREIESLIPDPCKPKNPTTPTSPVLVPSPSFSLSRKTGSGESEKVSIGPVGLHSARSLLETIVGGAKDIALAYRLADIQGSSDTMMSGKIYSGSAEKSERQEILEVHKMLLDCGGQKEMIRQPGGRALKSFLDERMEDIGRCVTLAGAIGIDHGSPWTSRAMVWSKFDEQTDERDEGEEEKIWRFDRTVMIDPGLMLHPVERFKAIFGMKDSQEGEPTDGPSQALVDEPAGSDGDTEHGENSDTVTVWVSKLRNRDAFFICVRHILGASACATISSRSNTIGWDMLVNGDKACLVFARSMIEPYEHEGLELVGDLVRAFIEKTHAQRLEPARELIASWAQDASSGTPASGISEEQWSDLLRTVLPMESLGDLLSDAAQNVGDCIVEEMQEQSQGMVKLTNKLVEKFEKDLEDERTAHEDSRGREKKKFAKDLQAREKQSKGFLERANRLDAELRSTRAELDRSRRDQAGQVGQSGSSAPSASKTAAATHCALSMALDEVFS